MLVFEFLLSNRVCFLLVGTGFMPLRCAATRFFFRKRFSLAQFPPLSSWRRRCGGRAWNGRCLFGLIGGKCFTRRHMPKDASGLILRINLVSICRCLRCLPAFNGTQIHGHGGRREWRQVRRLRWLGAVILIWLNDGHWMGWAAGWDQWGWVVQMDVCCQTRMKLWVQ